MESRDDVDSILRQSVGTLWQERMLLKDRAASLLRGHIVSGRIGPGTKLVEQSLSDALGISRMPIRDALMKLEEEGLVVSRSSGRFVIELSDRDIRELYQIRTVLEELAVELAARNVTAEGRAQLQSCLDRMADAMGRRDHAAFVDADLDIHRALWRQSGHQYLVRTLETMLGPIMMFVSNTAEHLDWEETLALHAAIVDAVVRGDVEAARGRLHEHMESIFEQLLS